MPTTTRTRATTTATTTPPKNTATGLSPAQKAAYGRKLIAIPDLAARKADVQRAKKEALAEGHPRLANVATDRLALIAAEQNLRAALGSAKLSDGSTGAQLATLARAIAPENLKSRIGSLATKLKNGSAPADAKTRLAVLTRERDRRGVQVRQQQAAKETGRLTSVKAAFKQSLAAMTPKQLLATQKTEHANVAAAKATLETTQASGSAPAIAKAERNLRSAYARAAVIDAAVPVPFDRAAMRKYAQSLKAKTAPQLEVERARLADAYAKAKDGVVRGSRQQLRTLEVQLAVVDQAIAKKAAPAGPVAPINSVDKTRNPGNVVFDGPGMMVDNAALFSPSEWIPRLKAAGTTYVELQIHNGPSTRHDNIAALQAGWADQFRAAGIKVGFWGVSYGGTAEQTAKDAKLAAELTAQFKADFYVANCEGPFQDKQGDPALNKVFVDNFQAEATAQGIGNIPRALSSMGRVALDMGPWINNGWDAKPQAYWNDFAVYQPSACVKFYEDWGWPKGRIHPTIGTYNATGDGKITSVSEYVADLKAAGSTGVSFYLPENYMDGTQWQQWVDGLANGMNGPPR